MWKEKMSKTKKQVICVPSTGRGRVGPGWESGWMDTQIQTVGEKWIPSKRRSARKYGRENGPLSYHYKYSKGWNHGGHQTHLAKTGTYS